MTAANLKWSSRCRTEALLLFFLILICFLIIFLTARATFVCQSWILMPATLVPSDIFYLPFPPLSSDRCPLAETDSLNVGTVNCRTSAEPFLNDVKPRKGCDIVAIIAFVFPLLASLHLYSLVLFQLLPFFIPATNEWPLHDVTTLIHNKRNFSSLWNANMIKRCVEASYQSAPS